MEKIGNFVLERPGAMSEIQDPQLVRKHTQQQVHKPVKMVTIVIVQIFGFP